MEPLPMTQARQRRALRRRWSASVCIGLSVALCSCLMGGFEKGIAIDGDEPGNGQTCDKDRHCDVGWSCVEGYCRADTVQDAGEPAEGTEAGNSDSSSGPTDAGSRRDGPQPTPPEAPGEWIWVPAGSFTMGSPESEMGRLADELEHPVTLTHDVWLQETEITQAQFEELMGYNPAHYGPQGTGADCGPDCPVESVSWHELAAYSNELSRAEGLAECYSCAGAAPDYECEPADQETGPYECPGYRLPTEAEWEYAVRAGDRRATYNGDVATIDCISSPALDPIAWHCANSLATTHPVAKKEPNQWGLFDMLGNVYEWCHDWYGAYPGGPATNPDGAASGTERVIRGGSCLGNARWARAAHRDSSSPDLRAWALGGRVARSQL